MKTLTAGLFNFTEFEDAVMFLTSRGWFDDQGWRRYDHMRDLAWACGDIEITRPCMPMRRARYSNGPRRHGRDPRRTSSSMRTGFERTRRAHPGR